MLTVLLLLAAGLALLTIGGEILVRGASRLAAMAGISPLVIGLTVVAFGTSAPELAVSLISAHAGQADLAIGNVVGSNICNILLILGLSALITPLVVHQQLIRLEIPLMIAASLLLIPLGLDGRVSHFEGAALFAGVLAYTLFVVRKSRRESREVKEEYVEGMDLPPRRGWQAASANLLLVGGGVAMLVFGSQWLVEAAVSIARFFGVSELVIGLTVIAIGTSLPEGATSVVAAIRGERDIAVGNVIGSNLFNILCVLGLSGLLVPDGIPVPAAALRFDIPVMIAVAIACLPVFFVGYRISRWEGGLFSAFYLLYLADLVMTATAHSAQHGFRLALVWFVIPLTVVTLAVVSWRSLRNGNPSESL